MGAVSVAVTQLFRVIEERAHRCLSFSFSKTSRTPFDLLGVTNDRMTSSPTMSSSRVDGWSAGVCGVVGASGVEGTGSNTSIGSSLRNAKKPRGRWFASYRSEELDHNLLLDH